MSPHVTFQLIAAAVVLLAIIDVVASCRHFPLRRWPHHLGVGLAALLIYCFGLLLFSLVLHALFAVVVAI